MTDSEDRAVKQDAHRAMHKVHVMELVYEELKALGYSQDDAFQVSQTAVIATTLEDLHTTLHNFAERYRRTH